MNRRILICLGVFILLAALASVAWFIMLQHYLARIPKESSRNLRKSDVIIVLTGSTGRISRGIELFNRGKADRLFISGMSRDADISSDLAEIPKQKRQCCVSLGYAAPDTRGNAQESAQFIKTHQLNSVILVTADFHMPRSLLEFQQSMPNSVIIPEPVINSTYVNGQWWRHRKSLFLILREFHKYTRTRIWYFFTG